MTPSPTRVLRRSRTGRVGAGVAAGLGDYFRVDPVLFRVLFATSAFFGGAGILAYLLAWAAIPEVGTERAPIDGWVATLRRRRIPLWAVIIVGGFLLWTVAFSWWLPGPAFFAIVVAVLLVVFFGRRDWQANDEPVDLTKPPPVGSAAPTWIDDARAWVAETRAAARNRRRRARPVQLTTVLVLAATLVALGIVDSVSGIDLQWYFWATLAIVGIGLTVGAVARRFPLAVIWLILPSVVGAIAFAGSHASLHDGIGTRLWTPTTTPHSQYKLAFGRGVLDLRSLPAQTTPRTIRITMGAGQVRVLTSKTANVGVVGNVHIGQVLVDSEPSTDSDRGLGVNRTIAPPASATGARITVEIHLADGQIRVER